MPLFRALRGIEIASGNILIPKNQAPFRAHPVISNVLPFMLGEREEHAVRNHQWDGQLPTRGISCTTDWNVAVRYAAKEKVIVSIDEAACGRFGIRRYRVLDYVPLELIIHPDDEEIILVWKNDGDFPKEIISDVFHVS